MTNKEILFFIAKCLTINHNSENKGRVTDLISSGSVDWDKVVQISTSQYVFPALYINLKRANLLSYLPEELVNYMDHITSLNRERNLEIIQQAKELNSELKKNGINPIFLKGTGFLLQNFYHDPGERMVGDIDFLVEQTDFIKAAKILESKGYVSVYKGKYQNPVYTKHYPRLHHENKIAAVEVHRDMVKSSLSKVFNYNSCQQYLIKDIELKFLGFEDQLALTILAKEHNDDGKRLFNQNLRSSYDTFLLSQTVDFNKFKKKYNFYHSLLNPFLRFTSIIMNSKKIKYDEDSKSLKYQEIALRKINDSKYCSRHTNLTKKKIYLNLKFKGLLRFFSNQQFRNYYIKKLLKI